MLRLAANETAHSHAAACVIGTDWPSVAITHPSAPSTLAVLIWSIVVTGSPSSPAAVSTSMNTGSMYDSPGSRAGRTRTSVAFIVVLGASDGQIMGEG